MKKVFLIPVAIALLVAAGFLIFENEVPQEEFSYFREHVVDVLNRNCTRDCHGESAEVYRLDQQAPAHLGKQAGFRYVVDEGTGMIQSEEQIRIAYEESRGEPARSPSGSVYRRIDSRYPARFSPLVRNALARAYSNAIHPGGDVFATPEEEDFQRLLSWVEMEIAAHPEPPRPVEHRGEIFFRDNVMPVLVKKNCLGANCHGTQAFSDLRFDTGVNFGVEEYGPIIKGVSYQTDSEDPGLDRQSSIRHLMNLTPAEPTEATGSNPVLERFTDEMLRSNRIRAMGAIMGKATGFVTLGDVEQSKFLLKNLPLSEGGIFHKGGNNFFVSRRDPDFQTLVDWLRIEKKEAEESLRSEGKPLEKSIGEVRGILFVRTRPENKRRFFDVDTFLPGARLFVLPVQPGETLREARGPRPI